MDDKAQLYFNVGWQEWSKFSKNELSFRNDQVIVQDRNWDDTWHAGIAAVRKLSPNSLVSIGLAYDSSPVKDAYRTLDFPVDEQWKLSAAYGWKHSDDMSFSLGRTLSFVGDAALEQTAQRVTVRGDYDTNFLAGRRRGSAIRFLDTPFNENDPFDDSRRGGNRRTYC